MQKTLGLFESWNKAKRNLEQNQEKKIVKVGEIWLYKVGINLGGEISKDGEFLRPCIILKTHLGRDLITIVPLTTQYHELHDYQYMKLNNYNFYGLHKESWILLNQSKTISMKRLERLCNNFTKQGLEIPKIPIEKIEEISIKIKRFMFL